MRKLFLILTLSFAIMAEYGFSQRNHQQGGFPGQRPMPMPNPGMMASNPNDNSGSTPGSEPIIQLLGCYKSLNSAISSLENSTKNFNQSQDLQNLAGLDDTLKEFITQCSIGTNSLPNSSGSIPSGTNSSPNQLSCDDYITRIKDIISSIFTDSTDFMSAINQISSLLNIIPQAQNACNNMNGFLPNNNHP